MNSSRERRIPGASLWASFPKYARCFFAVGAVWGAVLAYGEVVPLDYIKVDDNAKGYHPSGYRGMSGRLSVKNADVQLPQFNSRDPIFYDVQLGDEARLLVLDRQKQDDVFYNRLYFDANANGDLTDDPVVDTKISARNGRSNCHATFPAIDTVIRRGTNSQPYRFQCKVSTYQWGQLRKDKGLKQQNLNRLVRMQRSSRCYYGGTFTQHGTNYMVALADSGCDGSFDSMVRVDANNFSGRDGRIYMQGDLFHLSEMKKHKHFRREVLCPQLVLNDQLYDVSVDIQNRTLTLAPVTEGLLAVELGMDAELVCFIEGRGDAGVMMFWPSTFTKLRSGKYRLARYQAVRKDEWGDGWALYASGTKYYQPVKILEDGENILPFGEPYEPLVDVAGYALKQYRDRGKDLRLSFTLKGNSHETVTDVRRISGRKSKIETASRDSARPLEPSYKIVTADGEILTQGNFEYG